VTGGAAALYTPEVLALATSLADFPLHGGLPLRGEARSASCGSRLTLGLACDAAGTITAVGVSASACAVGQAAAAIFVGAAQGQGEAAIRDARAGLAAWLAGDAPIPEWPGLAAIAAARAYPARHGAIMLAWNAGAAALSSRADNG